MASQLIQYGRWNDIKVYPLLMTFSNKEEPKVHVMLEVRLSVIGWIIWVLSSSFYWKIKNELTISCLLSWENSWSSECRQSELLPRWLWRLTGWPNNNSWELCSPAAPDSRGPHTSHLTGCLATSLACSSLGWQWHSYLLIIKHKVKSIVVSGWDIYQWFQSIFCGHPVIISSLK